MLIGKDKSRLYVYLKTAIQEFSVIDCYDHHMQNDFLQMIEHPLVGRAAEDHTRKFIDNHL